MTKKDVEDFIRKYNLPNCFGITKDDNGNYIVIDINDCESGYYRGKQLQKIELYDVLTIIAPVYERMCDCMIFNYGDIILSQEETWDGWQPDFVIEKYYNYYNLSNPFD